MLCKSNSETNLANINISISLASSVEGLNGSSCHSGELACDHNSSHYNVSPVQSDSEGEGNIMEADTPTVPSSSQATGGRGGGEVDLPPLRQEELAMVSMSVGGRLPHLTLLLGMEYAEYENIASAVGSSQETQALQVSLVHQAMKRRMGGGVRRGVEGVGGGVKGQHHFDGYSVLCYWYTWYMVVLCKCSINVSTTS